MQSDPVVDAGFHSKKQSLKEHMEGPAVSDVLEVVSVKPTSPQMREKKRVTESSISQRPYGQKEAFLNLWIA